MSQDAHGVPSTHRFVASGHLGRRPDRFPMILLLANANFWKRFARLDRSRHGLSHEREEALAILGIGDPPPGDLLRASKTQICGYQLRVTFHRGATFHLRVSHPPGKFCPLREELDLLDHPAITLGKMPARAAAPRRRAGEP